MAFPTTGAMDPSLGLSNFTTAPPSGMFGSGKFGFAQALTAALNGYLAAMPGPSQAVGLAGLKAQADRRQMMMEEQLYEHRQDLQMQREMAMLPYQLRMKLLYPDSPEAQTAAAAGMVPGSAQWQQHFGVLANNAENPVVNAGLYGPVLRSQVVAGANASPAPNAAAIARLKSNPQAERANFEAAFGPGSADQYLGSGGQTGATQSGGFLGSPYAPIDGYPRY